MNELITNDNERIIRFFKNLEQMLGRVECMTKGYRPTLGGERFFPTGRCPRG